MVETMFTRRSRVLEMLLWARVCSAVRFIKKNFIDVDFQAAKGREPEEGKKITTFKTFELPGQIISGLLVC